MYQDHYEERENRRTEVLERYTVLTPADIMDILNIGKNAAYELLNSGQLKGFRIGRNWRITSEELERFMLNFDTIRDNYQKIKAQKRNYFSKTFINA